MEIDDRSDYQRWLDGNDTGTPDPEQQAQLDVNQNTLAPEGTNEIDTSLLDIDGVESTPATAEQPATPEEPEQSYGEKATENESVVEQWIGDGLAFIKDAFDDRDYDEIRQEITDNNTKRDDSKNVVQKSLDEIEKIGGNAIAQPLNAIAQVGKLGLDTVGSALGMRGDAPAPWDSAYEGAEFNLVGSKPVTEIGQASAAILGFMNNNRILNQVLPGKNASGVEKFARNTGIDMVADAIFSPGKGNLINLAQDTEFFGIGKLMKDTGFLDALAHKDEDNEFIRRIKNAGEGGVIGKSIDGVGLVYKGLRELINNVAGPYMVKKGVSYNQLPSQVKEANQIIFDKITALDEFDLKSPEALEATSEFRGTKAKAEVASNTAEYQTTNIDRQAAEVSDELAGLKQKVEADTAAKEVEKDALLYKLYKEQTTRLDELAKEVKGDADALAAIEQAKLIDEQIQLDLGSYSNSFTAKLKKPRPMGQTELPLDGFKGVNAEDTPISKMDADFKAERRQAWKEKFNKLSEAERKPFYERRPGFDERKAEDIANSGTKDQQLYEANERASRTSSFPVSKVSAQQAAIPEFGTPARRPSTDPIMTDAMTRQLNAVQGDTSALIERLMPEEFRAEMDEFRQTNKKTSPENVAKIVNARDRFKAGEEPIGILREIAQDGGLPMPLIRTIAGDQIARVILTDLGSQIREQVPLFHEIIAKGGDATRQANMIIDDLIAVGQEGIRGRSYKGSALNALRTDMTFDEFITRYDKGEYAVPKEVSVKTQKDLDIFTKQWEEVRQGILTGDPKAVEKMDVLSEALVLADGKPELIQTFAQQVLNLGSQNFRTVMYNSYLSSLRTHERNIIGTGTNVALKPLLAAGGSLFKPQQAKDALSMYSSILGGINDAMAAARIQWQKTGDGQVARGYLMSKKNMTEIVDNLARQAKTPGQVAASAVVRAQYYLMASPAGQYATRAMNSTDAAFRTISARQTARFEYMAEIAKDQRVFDADELNVKIAEKFDQDFSITDPVALRHSKEDTFQTDLTGFMAKVDDTIKAGGVLTQLAVPFVKTPTVILSQTPQFMPIIPMVGRHTDMGGKFMKEYHAVTNGDDELLKAVYKGREGAAYILGMLGTSMAMNGVLTGSGHYDYGERKLDELESGRHSFKWVDGKWYSHRSLGPISTVLSMWADVGYVASNSHRYDDYNEYYAQAAYTIAGSLFEQSWLKGLTAAVGVFEEMVNGRRVASAGDTIDSLFASVMSAFTLYGGALKDFNNFLVPGAREYNSNMERYWASTVPLLKSQLGAEKISPISGNPIVNDGTARTNILTPFSIKDIQESEAVSLLIKYGIDYTLEMNDHYKGVKLGPVDKHNINKLMAKGTTSQGGLEKQLIHWMTSPAFEKMHTDWLEYPTPKKDQEWYTETTSLIAKIRKEAVEAYILTKPTEAQELRSRIDQAQKVKIMENARNQQALKKEYEALLELNLP